MKRLLILALVTAATWHCSAPARAGNVNFPFNASSEGWSLVPNGSGSLYWEWAKDPSNTEGGLHAWVNDDPALPADGTTAYALSPLFVIDKQGNDEFIHMDFEYWADLLTSGTTSVLGQVQYSTNPGLPGSWKAVPAADYLSNSHVLPNAIAAPPLIGSEQNAFSGQLGGPSVGNHVSSAFELKWTDTTPNLQEGDTIQFLFMVGIHGPLPADTPKTQVWELDRVQITGVKVAPVPEPGSMALAGMAAGTALVTVVRRRLGRRPAQRPGTP